MAKNRKPSSSSPNSPKAAGPEPAAEGGEVSTGDFPLFEPDDLPDTMRNAPAPPSSEATGDGDITLDDHQDRQQQRPRLPDHRREKRSFEMSSSVAPSRDSTAPVQYDGPGTGHSAESTSGLKSAAADEIETYDPLASATPSAASAAAAPAPQPVSKPAVEIPATPGLDDLEEFIARTATESRKTENSERVRRPLSLVEKICSAAGAAILIVVAAWLITSITSEAVAQKPASKPWPNLPMEGSLITINEAAASWRKRADTDRVAQMEVILPVPGQQMPGIIPQVTFSIDAGKSTNGYLRFIFKDTEGKPRGDTRVVEVQNGKLKDMGKGEIIKGDTEGSIYCSYGLLNTSAYRSYEGDDKPRWSVEVAESASYDADDKDWKILGTFNVRNEFEE